MAEPKLTPASRTSDDQRPRIAPVRTGRPDAEARATRAALLAEAERIMGVTPIEGRTGPRPGY